MAGPAPDVVAAAEAPGAAVADRDRCDVPAAWTGALVVVLLAGAAWGFARPLWLDEAYSLAAVEDPWRALVSDRGSMAAFHALLWPLRALGGEPWILRLPALAATVAALVLVVRGVAADHGRRAAVAAGLFLATAWPVVSHAQEARAYALGLLVAATQWRLLGRWLGHGERRAIRWWAVLAVAGTAVHGLAVLQVLAQLAAVEACGFDPVVRRPVRRGAAAAAVAPAGLALLGAATLTPYQPPLALDTLVTLVEDLVGPGLLGAPVLVLAGVGAARLVRRARTSPTPARRFAAIAPLAWTAVPPALLCAISLVTPKLVPRYVFPSIVGVAILVGVGVAALPARRTLVGAVAVASLLAVHQVHGHQAGTGDWRGAAALVAEGAHPGDAVVFPRANRRPPFEAEWVRRARVPDVAAVNPDRPLGRVRWLEQDAPIAVVLADAARHDRLWVVTEPFSSVDRERPVADGLRAAGYRVADERDFGMSIRVTLFVRR